MVPPIPMEERNVDCDEVQQRGGAAGDGSSTAQASSGMVEITGLELLGYSEHSDDSDFSFDSYAHDSFDHAYQHTMMRQKHRHLTKSQLQQHQIEEMVAKKPISRRRMSNVSSIDGDEFSLDFNESADLDSYAADSVMANHHRCSRKHNNHKSIVPNRRASLGNRTAQSSTMERGNHASRRGSLDSYAMDSVQLKLNLPRRMSNYSDYANDSFDVARQRRSQQAGGGNNLYENYHSDLSTIKRRISLDSTYNFSQGVYETQSIHGGAGRAA